MKAASVPIGVSSTPTAKPKFAFAGTVETPNFLLKVIAALAIGLLLSIPIFAIPRVTAAQAGVLALTAHAIGAWSANVVDYWATHYFVLGSQIAMFVGAGVAGAADHDHEAAHRGACGNRVRAEAATVADARRCEPASTCRWCRSIFPPIASRPRCCARRWTAWLSSTGPIWNAWW